MDTISVIEKSQEPVAGPSSSKSQLMTQVNQDSKSPTKSRPSEPTESEPKKKKVKLNHDPLMTRRLLEAIVANDDQKISDTLNSCQDNMASIHQTIREVPCETLTTLLLIIQKMLVDQTCNPGVHQISRKSLKEKSCLMVWMEKLIKIRLKELIQVSIPLIASGLILIESQACPDDKEIRIKLTSVRFATTNDSNSKILSRLTELKGRIDFLATGGSCTNFNDMKDEIKSTSDHDLSVDESSSDSEVDAGESIRKNFEQDVGDSIKGTKRSRTVVEEVYDSS